MDVLFCSINDWANVGALFAKALRSIGVDALSAVRYQHGYEYTDKSVQWSCLPALQALANKAKTIVYMHSELLQLDTRGKRLAVFHGGTRYREKSAVLLPKFNAIVDVTLTQTANMLGRGAKNEVWIFPPVNTVFLRPKYKEDGGPLAFGHYPRNMKFKGTGPILQTLRGMGIDVLFSSEIVSWQENMKRVAACDVYVERMCLHRGSFKTGVWGMTAMEAAALGKIVITNDLWRKLYEREFGPSPVMVANSPKELAEAVERLQAMSSLEIMQLQSETRRWVVERHGFEPTGKRLKEVLL